ncbi:MAG: hypothetical protein AB1502_14395 [Thermodesulfobacteriota bacterium]
MTVQAGLVTTPGVVLGEGLKPSDLVAQKTVAATLQSMRDLRRPNPGTMRIMAGYALRLPSMFLDIYLRKVAGPRNEPGMA